MKQLLVVLEDVKTIMARHMTLQVEINNPKMKNSDAQNLLMQISEPRHNLDLRAFFVARACRRALQKKKLALESAIASSPSMALRYDLREIENDLGFWKGREKAYVRLANMVHPIADKVMAELKRVGPEMEVGVGWAPSPVELAAYSMTFG